MLLRTQYLRFKGKSLDPELRIKKWHILKGDMVEVIRSYDNKDKGKQGKVLKVFHKTNRLVVEGVNLRQRTSKRDVTGSPRNFFMAPSPVHYSRVALIDPTTKKPTKISIKLEEKIVNGEKVKVKVRVAKKTGAVIEKPTPDINREKRHRVSPKDTPPELALKKTFNPDTLNPLKLASLEHRQMIQEE